MPNTKLITERAQRCKYLSLFSTRPFCFTYVQETRHMILLRKRHVSKENGTANLWFSSQKREGRRKTAICLQKYHFPFGTFKTSLQPIAHQDEPIAAVQSKVDSKMWTAWNIFTSHLLVVVVKQSVNCSRNHLLSNFYVYH